MTVAGPDPADRNFYRESAKSKLEPTGVSRGHQGNAGSSPGSDGILPGVFEYI